jgi:hypothetical protein
VESKNYTTVGTGPTRRSGSASIDDIGTTTRKRGEQFSSEGIRPVTLTACPIAFERHRRGVHNATTIGAA